MIRVTPSTPVLVAIEPVDFRRQIDGLVAHCRQALSGNPMSGTLFVFINRARTMIRVLVYDGSGFWLMTKRLSKGRFTDWPTSQAALCALSAKVLMQILQIQDFPPAQGAAENMLSNRLATAATSV
jgi:transposase